MLHRPQRHLRLQKRQRPIHRLKPMVDTGWLRETVVPFDTIGRPGQPLLPQMRRIFLEVLVDHAQLRCHRLRHVLDFIEHGLKSLSRVGIPLICSRYRVLAQQLTDFRRHTERRCPVEPCELLITVIHLGQVFSQCLP